MIQRLVRDIGVRDEKMGQADGSTAVQRHSGYFLSALQSFPCIMLYANSTYDNTVPYATGMAIGHDVDSIEMERVRECISQPEIIIFTIHPFVFLPSPSYRYHFHFHAGLTKFT